MRTTLFLLLLTAATAAAVEPPQIKNVGTWSNALNPAISVVGWLQGTAGHNPQNTDPNALRLREAEIAFQSDVDPYAQAQVFASVNDAGAVELEEGFLLWKALPFSTQARVGKFRLDLGKFNRIHPPETSFADRPQVHLNFLGNEGLAGTGGNLSWLASLGPTVLQVDGEITNSPEAAEAPAFAKARRQDLLYLGRLSAYRDLTEASNVTLGASAVRGPNGFEVNAVDGSSSTLHTHLFGADLTFRWKNPRRAIYRSFFWQTEALAVRRDGAGAAQTTRWGLFSHVNWQILRRWHVGARYDRSQILASGRDFEEGGLVYLTFTPSEFSLISLQGKRLLLTDHTVAHEGFLKMTFNIGPHGTHPF